MREPKIDNELAGFVHELAICRVSSNVYNQYSYDCSANAVCRNNLLRYLRQMAGKNPKVLLVGEAAGYRGCRLTGVPFTSEEILMRGIPEFGLFGEPDGYHINPHNGHPCSERTATIVWDVLSRTVRLPILWNSYPFHPFRANSHANNRTPTKSEINVGKPFLLSIMCLFNICTVVAVGRKAETAINSMGIPHHNVRHPSYGGKNDFKNGLMQVIQFKP